MAIKAIILDWAGTSVDYGCFAPVEAFHSAFQAVGMNPTIDEIRAPMGMGKKAHIAAMLHEKPHTEKDIDEIYSLFESCLFEGLAAHTDPLPGVVDTVATLREMGIKIGSTTGYTRAMMDVVAPGALEKGYAPDCLVCPEEAGGLGRPFPHMLWRNLETLQIASISQVVKVGDTEADIREGVNAGCVSVGVLEGSSMLGLNQVEFASLAFDEALDLLSIAQDNYKNAGADFVIRDFAALPALISSINKEQKDRNHA